MATPGARTYLKTHKLRGKALQFRLADEQAALLSKAARLSTGRTAKTLVKEGALRVTMVALKKGAKMARHHVDGQTAIHVLRGRVQFVSDAGATEVSAGGVVVFDRGVQHEVLARADSAFLMTMAWRRTR